jgi:hypothetical protein
VPTARDGRRLRKRYGKLRAYLFAFLEHPEIAADNNSSERELRPTATYRKVTGRFRSKWGRDRPKPGDTLAAPEAEPLNSKPTTHSTGAGYPPRFRTVSAGTSERRICLT